MVKKIHHLQLGDTLHQLHHYQNGFGGPLLVRVHGNEVDARSVGLKWFREQGGAFIDVDNATREVNFRFNRHIIQFDPNRIFSVAGVQKTLQDYQSCCDHLIIAEIEKFKNALLSLCDNNKPIIALHNNEDFNIHYYADGGENVSACDELHINIHLNPHNFIIVTQRDDFELLQQLNINVVLECQQPAHDTGSFSEHCLLHNRRYFNIEAQFGCAKEQWEMLAIVDNLSNKPCSFAQ